MSNFYNDTIKANPNFTSTKECNDVSLLDPVTRTKVQALIDDAAAHGVSLMVFETYRSKERLVVRGSAR